MATNLALQLQVIEPDTDLNSIMIGNSNYNDDVWDLRPISAQCYRCAGAFHGCQDSRWKLLQVL